MLTESGRSAAESSLICMATILSNRYNKLIGINTPNVRNVVGRNANLIGIEAEVRSSCDDFFCCAAREIRSDVWPLKRSSCKLSTNTVDLSKDRFC